MKNQPETRRKKPAYFEEDFLVTWKHDVDAARRRRSQRFDRNARRIGNFAAVAIVIALFGIVAYKIVPTSAQTSFIEGLRNFLQ